MRIKMTKSLFLTLLLACSTTILPMTYIWNIGKSTAHVITKTIGLLKEHSVAATLIASSLCLSLGYLGYKKILNGTSRKLIQVFPIYYDPNPVTKGFKALLYKAQDAKYYTSIKEDRDIVACRWNLSKKEEEHARRILSTVAQNQNFTYTLHKIANPYDLKTTVYFYEVDHNDFPQQDGLYEWKQFSTGRITGPTEPFCNPEIDTPIYYILSNFYTSKRFRTEQ